MAVFLRNNCSFAGCGQTFSKLAHLIHHIEDCHIASDPDVLEKQESQQPPSTNIGYILRSRFFDDDSKNRRHYNEFTRPESPDLVQRSVTPAGSECDGEDEEISVYSEDDEGNESESSFSGATTQGEDYSYEFIISMVKASEMSDGDKPLKCPVTGCKKQYKNINGMKYHAKTAHKRDISRVLSTYSCTECKKNYKTQHGLRNHFKSQHPHLSDIHIQFISTNSTSTNMIYDLSVKSAGMSTSKRKLSKVMGCSTLESVKREDIVNQNYSTQTAEMEDADVNVTFTASLNPYSFEGD